MELKSCLSKTPLLIDPLSRQGFASLEASRALVTAACQEQHLEMELVTAEGDRVTLSLGSQSRALAVSYAEIHAGTCQDSLNKGELSAGEQERSISLIVQGDLNEQEQKDLRKVLKTLKKMMGHFVNDRLKPMLDNAKQLGKLETVAGLAVDMSYSRQVLVAEQTRINTTYNQLGALEPHAPGYPPTERPPQPDDNWQAIHQEAEALTNAMAEQLKQVREFIEQMQENIRDMFDRFRDQAAGWNSVEPAGPDLISKIQEDLMAHALLQEVQPKQSDD